MREFKKVDYHKSAYCYISARLLPDLTTTRLSGFFIASRLGLDAHQKSLHSHIERDSHIPINRLLPVYFIPHCKKLIKTAG